MKPRIRNSAAVLAAGVAIFALPTAANAAVTVQADATNLTLTSDAASDNITLGVTGANINHNLPAASGDFASNQDFDPGPGTLNLPSNGTVNLTVDGGDGNDNINVSAPSFAGTPVLRGGGGDDIMLGTALVDDIDGGDGNDRITAFRGSEPINGGNGNDVIIWNNGDGNDTNNGGAGLDETLITQGNADDLSAITQVGATVHFERTNAPFTVDSNEMEKLTLTSFSGNDTLTTGPGVTIPMVIDAGPGDDNITTGGGTDRIVGDRGNDTMNGGDNDDTLVWSNGDGNDVMNGDGGIDRIENNLGAADDVSTLKVENGRVRYDRVNAPFNLSVGSSEVFELNTFGGKDTLTTVPNLPITLDADLGAGDDDINVRDGVQSIVQGGAGADKVTADVTDLIAADVETVDRPAVPGAGTAVLAKNAKVKRGVASLKMSCPAGTSGCNGKVTLVTKTLKFGPFRGALVLGAKNFKIDAGKSATVKVKLIKGAQRLAKRKKLVVNARIVSNGMSDKTTKVTLRF
jgi:Ca2+-binding RTX toxin-like protein